MPNQTIIEELDAIVKRAERIAYERGKADERRRMLALLSGGSGSSPTLLSDPVPTNGANEAVETKERQRAPRGIVPKFVNDVLARAPGLTPKEILARASTEFERMIKPASIRSELQVGRKAGRYIDRDGQWFLAQTKDKGKETDVAHKAPPVSLFPSPAGGSHGPTVDD